MCKKREERTAMLTSGALPSMSIGAGAAASVSRSLYSVPISPAKCLYGGGGEYVCVCVPVRRWSRGEEEVCNSGAHLCACA